MARFERAMTYGLVSVQSSARPRHGLQLRAATNAAQFNPLQQLALFAFGLPRGLLVTLGMAEGDLRTLAFKQILHGEDLQLRKFAKARVIKSGTGGFGNHRFGGFDEGKENADGGFLTVTHLFMSAHSIRNAILTSYSSARTVALV